MTETKPSGPRLPHLTLDPSLYNPEPHEIEFFKAQTGIEDDGALKEHVIAVQKEAWEVTSILFSNIEHWKLKNIYRR